MKVGGLWLVGMLAGCSSNADPVARWLDHRGQAHERWAGDHIQQFSKDGGLELSDGELQWWLMSHPEKDRTADWRRRLAPPEEHIDFLPVMGWGDWVLWRSPKAPRVSEVAVTGVPDSVTKLSTPVIRGVQTLGWNPADGEWVAEIYIQPPLQMPLDVCISLITSQETLDTGLLLDGVAPLLPGASVQPMVRHRVWLHGVDWGSDAPQILMADCGTGGMLARASFAAPENRSDTLTVGLDLRHGTPVPESAWAVPPRGKHGLRRTPSGIVQIPGPPLPRVRKGEAWPVLVLSPVNPSRWDVEQMTSEGSPLIKAQALLSGVGTTIMGWNAPGTRKGASSVPSRNTRRVVPELFPHLQYYGVDGLIPVWEHFGDAGSEGVQDTIENAHAAGLRMGAGAWDQPLVFPYQVDDKNLVGGILSLKIEPAGKQSLSSIESRIVEIAGKLDVLLVQVEMEEALEMRVAAARRLSKMGVDGLWMTGNESFGPIEVIDGVPVVYSHPEVFSALNTSHAALRFYLNENSVVRLDLLALNVDDGGQLHRVKTAGSAKPWLSELMTSSRPFGTSVEAGQTMAAIRVDAHWPARDSNRSAKSFTPDLVERKKLPEPQKPFRCMPASPLEKPLNIKFGENLVLEGFEWIQKASDGTAPFGVKLHWRSVSKSVEAEKGKVYLNAGFAGAPMRRSYVPCEGSWGFDQWSPGERVTEQVFFWAALDTMPSSAELFLSVRVAGEVQRTQEGHRRMPLGEIQFELSEEPG